MTFHMLCVTLPHVVYVMFCAKEFKITHRVFMHVCMCRYNVVMISRLLCFCFMFPLLGVCAHWGYCIYDNLRSAVWVFLKFDIADFYEISCHFNFHCDWTVEWPLYMKTFVSTHLRTQKRVVCTWRALASLLCALHGSYTFGLLHKLGK